MDIKKYTEYYNRIIEYLKNAVINKPYKVIIENRDIYGFDISENIKNIVEIKDMYIIEHEDNLGIEIVIHDVNNNIIRKYISVPAIFESQSNRNEVTFHLITGVILKLTFLDLQNDTKVIE